MALLTTLVVLLGLSPAGVAYAEEYRDRGGDADRMRSDRVDAGSREEETDTPDDISFDEPDSSEDAGSTNRDRASTSDRDDESDNPDDPAHQDEPEGSDQSLPSDPPESLVEGTPCTKEAVACISLRQKKSWLLKKDDGGETVIERGPVRVATGGPGKETPLGDFVVEWKDKNHRSSEFYVPHGCTPGTPGCEGAPMSWAVFFAEGGIAFHEGTLAIRSSGCVRLTAKEAEYYYTFLQLGDRVEVRE